MSDQSDAYMRGWLDGSEDDWGDLDASMDRMTFANAETYGRGYAAGRAAYLAAEAAERRRLTECPSCHDMPTLGDLGPCYVCGGTGKRRE